jgi:hypothetical protein
MKLLPRQKAGLAVVVVSTVTIVAGVVGIVRQADDSVGTTPAPATTTTTAVPATTTTTVPVPAGETPEEFLADWVDAHRAHDVDFLAARLHPLVIDRYGEDQCRTYLDLIDGSAYAAEVLSVEPGTAPWVWALDGIETTVADAITVRLRRTEDGTTFLEGEVHLVAIGREIRWFTDCGTPLEGAA